MAETKRTFEQDDLFNRKAYAKFLEKLILNSGSYHRDDDVQAYTIAIDSPWGTGKSVFLEKFENMLEADCPDQIRVVHYNAWKNDFWDNAFEPFADAIFTSEWFCNALQDDTNEQSAKKFLGAAKNVMISFVKKELENHCDAELLEKAIADFAKGLKFATTRSVSFLSKSYLDYVASLKQMQDAMDEVLLKTLPGGKLVIIIDELDRCRPTFAIETLEIVKHIMDVKDVVYIFSLDVRQLGAAIKQVYGADTDATGYLMRFFSYYSRMPEADTMKILRGIAGHIDKIGDIEKFICEMQGISKALSLTARDLETIGKVYCLMLKVFLSEYECETAYLLYWTLLCVKYKWPLEYNEQMHGMGSSEQKSYGAFFGKKKSAESLKRPLKSIFDTKPLKEIILNRINRANDFEGGGITINTIEKAQNGGLRIKGWPGLDRSGFRMILCDLKEEESLSDLLFYPDLKRWDEIKDLTPAQFLLQQLEMFNFIPEIPTETE